MAACSQDKYTISSRCHSCSLHEHRHISPRRGICWHRFSIFVCDSLSILIPDCCALFSVLFFFFNFISFQYYWFFFPQKDFMVCYFNFLNSYSENGMLFFWLLFQKTITSISMVLSHALSHKNSLDLESEEMDSCLDSSSYFLCDPGHIAWISESWLFHLYNGHGIRPVLSRAKACVRSK